MAVPWRADQQAAPYDVDSEDDGSSDVAAAPPSAEVLAFLRGAMPRASPRDILKAWDATPASESIDERAQLCLMKLMEEEEAGPAAPGPSASPKAPARVVDAIDLTRSLGRPSAATNADDSDEVEIVQPVIKRDKGKGRAPPAHVIDIDSDGGAPAAGPSHRPIAAPILDVASPPPNAALDQDGAIISLAALFPDIEPDFAAQTLQRAEWRDKALLERMEHAVEHLFSLVGAYPKVAKSAPAPPKKRKRSEAEEEAERLAAEEDRYLKRKLTDLPDEGYRSACIAVLCEEFPTMPKPHVAKVANRHRHWYSPTYEALEVDLKPRGNFIAFTPLKNPRKGKGAAIALPEDLDIERAWFHRRIAHAKKIKDAEEAQKLADEQEEAAGLLIPCGCCYGEAPFRKMVQCAEAHLFCMDCAKQHVETLIGQRRVDLVCMDESGCSAEFHDFELQRFLEPGTLELLARFRQEKAVDLAGIEGLEKCGFCDFAIIIENPDEKLFRCGNDECLKVLCRKCKKEDHLPKSCEEHEKDLAANSLHKVEEAMTAALVRNCPKCSQPYVKSDGCNKISCTHCGQLSCFICKQSISGYEHFAGGEAYTRDRRVVAGAKCPLFDDTLKRTHEEVEAARKAAALEVAKANPNVTAADLDRLKEPEPVRPVIPAHAAGYGFGGAGVFPHQHPHYAYGGGAAYNPGLYGLPIGVQGQAGGANPPLQQYLAQMHANIAAAQQAAFQVQHHAMPAYRGGGGRRRRR